MKSSDVCLSTKLDGMRANMLTQKDYIALSNCEDLNSFAEYLQNNTYYAFYLRGVGIGKLHRIDLEMALQKQKIAQAEKMVHFLQGEDKKFVRVMLMQLDIHVLNRYIRAIAHNLPIQGIGDRAITSKRLSYLDWEKLNQVEDWKGFQNALKETPYYREVETFLDCTPDQVYLIGKGLERFYFDTVKKTMDKMKGKGNEEYFDLLKRTCDLDNLMWIYRGKKYYNIKKETLLTYIQRNGSKLKMDAIKELVEIEDVEELMAEARKIPEYAFLFDHIRTLDIYMERRYLRYQYHGYKKIFRDAKTGLSKAMALYKLIDFELEDITSIIEGKRYHLEGKGAQSYLVRSIK